MGVKFVKFYIIHILCYFSLIFCELHNIQIFHHAVYSLFLNIIYCTCNN